MTSGISDAWGFALAGILSHIEPMTVSDENFPRLRSQSRSLWNMSGAGKELLQLYAYYDILNWFPSIRHLPIVEVA